MKKYPVIFILFVLIYKGFAQSGEPARLYTYTLGGNVFNGFVIKHDRYMGHLSQGITRGAEIYLNKNTYGDKIWEQVFKYPDVGFSFSWFDYGSDILGQSLGSFLYTDFILHRSSGFETLFKIGTGLGYHTKPYHPEYNNQNVAIGGPVSMSMQLRLGLNYWLSERLKLTGAFTISHYSMAAFYQPNKGINIVTANLGTSWMWMDQKPAYVPLNDHYHYDRRLRYNINVNYGLKEIPPIGGPRYPVYVMSMYVNKQITRTNIINIGMDGFNNTALIAEMEQADINPDDVDHKRLGLTAGHELKMGTVGLLTQLGIYLYRPYKTDKFIYQRYALKFYFNDRIFLHYGFLSHYSKADHVEFGLGLSI